MQTLEEMQDAKAYPEKFVRPVYASEEEYAKALLKSMRGKIPSRRIPKDVSIPDQTQNHEYRKERLTSVLRNGPMTRKEIKDALSVSQSTMWYWLKPLIENGFIVHAGERDKVELLQLAQAPRDSR